MLKIFYTIGVFDSDVKRSKCGYRLLRLALKKIDEENGIKRERDFQILYGENGKPYIEGGEQFNITHTKNLVMCAVSDKPVGIDAEYRRDGLFKTARKIFTAEENAAAEKLSRDEKQKLLLKRWVMSEAALKLTGEGIKSIFKEPLRVEMLTETLHKTTHGTFLHLYDLNEYAVCVATEYGQRPQLIEINFDSIRERNHIKEKQ